MRWLAFTLYLPLLSALSYRGAMLWPRPLAFLYIAVTAAVAWRAMRIGKKLEAATWTDVLVAFLGCAALIVRQLTISPP